MCRLPLDHHTTGILFFLLKFLNKVIDHQINFSYVILFDYKSILTLCCILKGIQLLLLLFFEYYYIYSDYLSWIRTCIIFLLHINFKECIQHYLCRALHNIFGIESYFHSKYFCLKTFKFVLFHDIEVLSSMFWVIMLNSIELNR